MQVTEDFDAGVGGHALADVDPLGGVVVYADDEFPFEGGGDGGGGQDQGGGAAFQVETGIDEGAGFEELLAVVDVVFP